MLAENAPGVVLPLKGGAWEASTNVEREKQVGDLWCWAACVSMVLKAFGNYKEQCEVAKCVFRDPCTSEDKVREGYDVGYPVADIKQLWNLHDVQAQPHSTEVKWEVVEKEMESGRPVELFLGVGDITSKDGHLVLIVGAEKTVSGKPAVFIADPVSTNIGLSPTNFDYLEAYLSYGTWSMTWTNLFWKGP